MANYLKTFETHIDYETYINGQNILLPNVSYCEDNNGIYYNPLETKVIVKFNVTTTSSVTSICQFSATSNFLKIEIDGVEQANVTNNYTFSTMGEHVIKYTLSNPTQIGTYCFQNCTAITYVAVPYMVTTISNYAFGGCSNLTHVKLGRGVTTMGSLVFNNCSALERITCFCKVAPSVLSQTFKNISSNGTLYIPKGSTGYNVWMGTGNYYLGLYNWTKVEQ